jgi:putative beta-1,4-xylosyltransferase IRX14
MRATSMAVGFHFSRLIVFLLFLPTPPINPAAHLVSLVSSPDPIRHIVFVGHHPIRVRAWPHPDPSELLKAHRILAAVQNARHSTKRRGAGPARPVIAVTPITTSALQVSSLTSLAHTLRLVDARLVWIVVEPGHRTDAVAAVLSRSNLDFLHITGPGDSTAPANPRPQVRTQAPTARWEGYLIVA